MKQRNGSSDRIDLASEADFRLGRMLIRPSHREVQVDGETSVLEPRVMQVLVALAAARPDVLSRDRLIELCWDGRLVGDDAINRCIVELRHLSSKSTPPAFTIENVRSVGYFLKAQDGAVAPSRSVQGTRLTWLVMGLLIFAALATLFLSQFTRGDTPLKVGIASQGSGLDSKAAREAVELAIAMVPSIASNVLISDKGGDGQLTLTSKDGGQSVSQVKLSLHSAEPIGHNFSLGGKSAATVEQAANYSVALLGCAAKYYGHAKALEAGEWKALIDVCMAKGSGAALSPTTLIILRRIAQRIPDWEAAWAAVLVADWLSYDEADTSPRLDRAIRRDVEAARQHFPTLAEIPLIEARLLPIGDVVARYALRKHALQQHPNDDLVVSEWAHQQLLLGYHAKSMLLSRKLISMQPFSPIARSGLAIGLAMDGKVQPAMAELDAADRLWPSREASDPARFLIALRLGDARVARSMVRRGWEPYTGQLTSAFVRARLEPTSANIDQAIRQSETATEVYPANDYVHAQTLAEFDRTDALYDFLMSPKVNPRTSHLSTVLFRPAFADLHHDPRFISVLARYGLLRIYQQSGEWPDFCVDPDLPYDCLEQAGRLTSSKRSEAK